LHAQKGPQSVDQENKSTPHAQKDLKALTQDTEEETITPTSSTQNSRTHEERRDSLTIKATERTLTLHQALNKPTLVKTARNLHEHPWQTSTFDRDREEKHISYQQTGSGSFKGKKSVERLQIKNKNPDPNIRPERSIETSKKTRSAHWKAQPSTKNEDQTIPTPGRASRSIGSTLKHHRTCG
jgi:hypothetical protein